MNGMSRFLRLINLLERQCVFFMKKFMLCALVLALLAAVVSPAAAWDPNKQKDLGQDHVKMKWYLLDYGKVNDTPFAISRKYYTNTSIKNDTVELLMSKFNIAPDVANSLYFTEYGYEYTPDGKQFAVTYLRHYDMLGNLIHGTNYDNSSEATRRTFAAVDPNSTPGKGAAYALGRTPSASKQAAKAPAKKTAPRKATVKKKK